MKHVWLVCLFVVMGGGGVEEIWPVLFLHISLRLYAVLFTCGELFLAFLSATSGYNFPAKGLSIFCFNSRGEGP